MSMSHQYQQSKHDHATHAVKREKYLNSLGLIHENVGRSIKFSPNERIGTDFKVGRLVDVSVFALYVSYENNNGVFSVTSMPIERFLGFVD